MCIIKNQEEWVVIHLINSNSTIQVLENIAGCFLSQIVEVIETDLKMMEKNVPKIRMILSSMDMPNMTLTEHFESRQVKQFKF